METKGREQGIGLIEVLVALAIIALVSGALIGALSASTKASAGNVERTTADSLAQAQLEQIMKSDYDVGNPPLYTPMLIPYPNYSIGITAEQLEDGLQKITVQVLHHENLVMSIETYKSKHD